jgi:amino acid transporter
MSKRVLSVFSLTMINVIALADVRSLPISAEYGWALIAYTLLGAIFFLIPCALIVSELATTWPKTGGAYIWVREAFGKRWGFLLVWIQWFYNIVWYPTIMTVLAVTLFYLVSPSLIQNKILLLSMMIGLFWLITLANCFGMKISSFVSAVGVILGVILPLCVLIGAAAFWFIKGNPIATSAIEQSFLPRPNGWRSLALLTGMVFSFVGIEMSSTHAQEVKNPGRDYPRACLYSVIILFFILSLGGLAVALVVPRADLGLTDGVIQGFAIIFKELNLPWLTPIMGGCIIIGGFSGVAAWVLGTSKSMMIVGKDGSFPMMLAHSSSKGVPRNMLIIQAFAFTILCFSYFLFDTLNSSYWLLSAMTSELALFFYILLFVAAIRLRYKYPDIERPFRIPGGNAGIWIVGVVGLLAVVFTFSVGLLPPEQLPIKSVLKYELILLGGIFLIMLPGFWFFFRHKMQLEP